MTMAGFGGCFFCLLTQKRKRKAEKSGDATASWTSSQNETIITKSICATSVDKQGNLIEFEMSSNACCVLKKKTK
jgi:hypothetical protein